ncbi:hypothetical protein EDB80DRAFT_690300 [Ilyonectria destructans]|nr:hypothetical protein EDB80DRAFT_690300 [Ilyonectria destructans]
MRLRGLCCLLVFLTGTLLLHKQAAFEAAMLLQNPIYIRALSYRLNQLRYCGGEAVCSSSSADLKDRREGDYLLLQLYKLDADAGTGEDEAGRQYSRELAAIEAVLEEIDGLVLGLGLSKAGKIGCRPCWLLYGAAEARYSWYRCLRLKGIEAESAGGIEAAAAAEGKLCLPSFADAMQFQSGICYKGGRLYIPRAIRTRAEAPSIWVWIEKEVINCRRGRGVEGIEKKKKKKEREERERGSK